MFPHIFLFFFQIRILKLAENGGYLAEKIRNVDKALQFCKYLRGKFPPKPWRSGQEWPGLRYFLAGSCTPSLLSRQGRCYQWSPLDGEVGRLDILVLFLFYSKVESFKISWNIFRSWSCLAIQKISNRGLFVNKIKNISIKVFQSVVVEIFRI